MEVDLRKVSVTIGMPVYGPIQPATVMSIASTVSQCAAMGTRCEFVMEQGVLPISRDAVLDDFLRDDTHKLFWIDSDMTWEPGDFLRLLALSTQVGVVCAAYPRKADGPTQFNIDLDTEAIEEGPHGLLSIRGAGLGFTVIDRFVADELAQSKPLIHDGLNGRSMRQVFRFDTVEGRRRTEDMAFFSDLRELGHRVWLDPTITLGHVGANEWRGRAMDAFTRTDA